MKLNRILLSAALAAIFLGVPVRAETPADAETPAVQKTLFQQIREGGWVMVPIGLCSIATLYLIGDGVIRTGRTKVMPVDDVAEIKTYFRNGDYVGAYKYCKGHPSPISNVIAAGVALLGDGKQATEEAILAEITKENSRIQTGLSYLSVIGVCAPMIGLLGTVTGMIRAFATLGSSGIGDPSSLSAAIGEVLVATASGLLVALPAFGGFYFLRNRAVAAVHDLQDMVARLFRKMPYYALADLHIGGDDLYASVPPWYVPGTTKSPVPAASGSVVPGLESKAVKA